MNIIIIISVNHLYFIFRDMKFDKADGLHLYLEKLLRSDDSGMKFGRAKTTISYLQSMDESGNLFAKLDDIYKQVYLFYLNCCLCCNV